MFPVQFLRGTAALCLGVILVVGCQPDARSGDGAPGHTEADDFAQDAYEAESGGATPGSTAPVAGVAAAQIAGQWVGEMGSGDARGEVEMHFRENGTAEGRWIPDGPLLRYTWSLADVDGDPVVVLRDVDLATTLRGTYGYGELAQITGDSLSLYRE